MSGEPQNVSKASVDNIVSAFEEGGGRLSLARTGLRVDSSAFEGTDQLVTEVFQRESEIVGCLADRRSRKVLPSVSRSGRAGRLAPTAAQAAWLDPSKTAPSEQWLPVLWLLEGDLDVGAFERSYARLLDLHDILRASVRGLPDNPEFVVAPTGGQRLEIRSLDHLPVTEAGLEIWGELKPFYEQPAALRDGLVRLRLYRLQGRRHLLGGFVHHLAFDGRSSRIFIGELMGRYFGYSQGVQPPEEKTLQYADFASWETSWLTPAERELADASWAYRLANARPLRFPNGAASLAVPSTIAGLPFAISSGVVTAAAAYARSQGVTLHMLFLAVLALVLAPRAGHRAPLFGLNVNGRPPGFDSVIGCFAQTRPFHISFEDDPTFEQFLRRARSASLAASDLQRPISPQLAASLGFQNVLVNYNARTDKSSTAPVQRQMQTNALPRSAREAGRYLLPSDFGDGSMSRSEGHANSGGRSPRQFQGVGKLKAGMTDLPKRLQTHIHRDLHFAIDQTEKGLSGRISYAADLFDHAWISAMARDLVAALKSAMQSQHTPVSRLTAAPETK